MLTEHFIVSGAVHVSLRHILVCFSEIWVLPILLLYSCAPDAKVHPYKNLRCPENLLLLKGITHSIKCCLKLMRIEYRQVSLEFYFHIMDNNLHLPADKCRKFMSKSNHLKWTRDTIYVLKAVLEQAVLKK